MPGDAERTPGFWDARSERYDRLEIDDFLPYAADVLRLVGIGPGDRALDVAAGPGTLALPAARTGAAVTAVDFAPAMIARLRAHAAAEGLENITAAVMDGQALALPDGAFDAAFSMFGLIFFPDRAAGFRELHRVLRPGGIAGVAGWGANGSGGPRFAQRAVAHVFPHLASASADAATPAFLSLQDPRDLAREMSGAGFSAVRIETIAHYKRACTPDEAWETGRGWTTVAALDEAGREAVRTAFLDLLRAQYGDGPVRFHGEAHIGIGIK